MPKNRGSLNVLFWSLGVKISYDPEKRRKNREKLMICDDRFCVVEASFALFKSSMYAHILFQKLNKKMK